MSSHRTHGCRPTGALSRRALALAALLTIALLPSVPVAQPTLSAAVRRYVKVDAKVTVLRNARVIDGTGAPPRPGQMVLIRDGRIAAMGAEGSIPVPPEASVVDLA